MGTAGTYMKNIKLRNRLHKYDYMLYSSIILSNISYKVINALEDVHYKWHYGYRSRVVAHIEKSKKLRVFR